ncbi:MAG TPA: hypothetical protein PK264_12720 [Hyphomicrobiaceae bacterium]|nr:hypothetical protein [Hyphomicrobiaceae bacterium]
MSDWLPDPGLGTEDLEKGMRAGKARHVIPIALIAIAMLATFNSGGLVKWSERLPSHEASLWVAEKAAAWHELMLELGPARVFEDVKVRLRIE